MSETPNVNNCSVCSKQKLDPLSYVMMDESVRTKFCQCEVFKDSGGQVSIQFCRKCNKQVQPGRAGSITQWIFRHGICVCEKADVISIDAKSIASAPATVMDERYAEDRINENEAAITDKGFPLEAFKPLEQLASGGFGNIYKCRNRYLGHLVVVKTLRRLTPDHLMQMQQEARMISRLNHDNILKIFDFGLVDDQYPFMVVEYIRGATLTSLLKTSGPLDLQLAQGVLVQICDGLIHAHERGIFHRDISSGNIMIESSDLSAPTVKIIDFGVAMCIAADRRFETMQGLTVVGTPAYMSPDQALGQPYDARSEVYSLGCLMFETVTGRTPFQADSALQMIAQHADTRAPKLDEVLKEKQLPVELVAIVDRCLSKSKADRYQSITELKTDLKRLEVQLRKQPRVKLKSRYGRDGSTPLTKRVSHRISLALACGIILIVATMMFQWLKTEQASKALSNSITLLELLSRVGNRSANLLLADRLSKGSGVQKDTQRAFRLFSQEAKIGNPAGLFALGECFQNGVGTEKNTQKARLYFAKAAYLHYPKAALRLTMSYDREKPRDHLEAAKWLQRAVEQGDPQAQCLMAMRSSAGPPGSLLLLIDEGFRRTTKTNEEMEKLLRMSANSGFLDAQFNLALCLERGFGMAQNRAESKVWYLKAAEQGDAQAQYRYAHMLEVDKQQQHDYKTILSWYRKSAKSGNWDAMVAMARCCAQGLGCAKDGQTAQFYLTKSFEYRDPVTVVHTVSLSTRMQTPTFRREPMSITARNQTADRQIWRGHGLVADDDLIQVATLPYIYNLDLTNMDITGSGVETLRAGPIRTLRLPGRLPDSVIKKIAGFKELRNLTVLGGMNPQTIRYFKGSNLLSMSFTTSPVNSATAEAICEIKSLRAFTAGNDRALSAEDVEKFASLPNLQELSFSIDKLNDAAVMGFNRMSKLRLLDLSLLSPNLTDSDLSPIKRLTCPDITVTITNSKHITAKAVEMLLALPRISELDVDEAPIAQKVQDYLEEKYPDKSLTVLEDGEEHKPLSAP